VLAQPLDLLFQLLRLGLKICQIVALFLYHIRGRCVECALDHALTYGTITSFVIGKCLLFSVIRVA